MLLERHTTQLPPDPDPGELPIATPALVQPRVTEAELRVTWIGHATVLVQLPGLNLLTDPIWSERSSPVGFAGPRRLVPAPIGLDALPPVDAVLLSHDHYDHLDRATVEALHARRGDALTWVTPLGYRRWFAGLGVRTVVELDWWERAELPGGAFEAVATPARHWTRRRPFGSNRRLWSGWVVRPRSGRTPGGRVAEDRGTRDPRTDGGVGDRGAGDLPRDAGPRLWFAGDSAYCPAFSEIGARLGPFDVSLLPIGAYEPRWFMQAVHMNPEEAARAFLDAGGLGDFVGIHWGTWRLTFENPLEPPERARAAWREAGLPPGRLRILRHGETLVHGLDDREDSGG